MGERCRHGTFVSRFRHAGVTDVTKDRFRWCPRSPCDHPLLCQHHPLCHPKTFRWTDQAHTVRQFASAHRALADRFRAPHRPHRAGAACSSMSDRVTFDPGLGLEISGRLGVPVIPTAAGHDAGVFAAHVPTAMLFVRNPSGVSHEPNINRIIILDERQGRV